MYQEDLKQLKPFSRASKYGAFFATNDGITKICIVVTNGIICGQKVSANDQSTSGMRNHLKKHPEIIDDRLVPLNAAIVTMSTLILAYTTKLKKSK